MMELVVLALGGLLLLTGIVGGGFELREIKIPRVGRVARILSTTAGVVLVLVGIGMVAEPVVTGSSSGSSSASEVPAAAVSFTIVDQLGENQTSEQVTVLLDGRSIGHLTVNTDFPYAEMTVTVSQPGLYSYTAEATAWFVDGETGEQFSYTGVGQGMIQVADGSVFELAGSVSGSSWVLTMVESMPSGT